MAERLGLLGEAFMKVEQSTLEPCEREKWIWLYLCLSIPWDQVLVVVHMGHCAVTM